MLKGEHPDTGKTIEYEGTLATRRSRKGILQGHVVLGYQLARKHGIKARLDADRLERHGGERDRLLLAGGEEHVHLARIGHRVRVWSVVKLLIAPKATSVRPEMRACWARPGVDPIRARAAPNRAAILRRFPEVIG